MNEKMETVTAQIVTGRCSSKPVAHFTNGKVNESRSSGLTLGQFVTSAGDRKRKSILVGESPNMSYIGKNFGPDASRAQTYCRYYVGVVDRKKGKMKVFDSEIVQMVPKLPDFQEEEEKDKLSIPEDLNKTYTQKIDDLTAVFGSKKKKQAMGSRLRNEIHGEALEQALNSVVSKSITDEKNINVDQPDSQYSLLPPCNKDAIDPKDVYPLDGIISQNVQLCLRAPAEVFFNSKHTDIKEWEEKEMYPKYIINHLAVLPINETKRWHQCELLMYINYLMYVYNQPAKTIKSKDPLPKEWPGPVKSTILNQFTLSVDAGQRKIRCLPTRLKDKLVLQILILCLIVDEFELYLNDIQKDLKMGGKNLDNRIRAVGCKVKTEKITGPNGEKLDAKKAVLTTPVSFDVPMPKAKKTRR